MHWNEIQHKTLIPLVIPLTLTASCFCFGNREIAGTAFGVCLFIIKVNPMPRTNRTNCFHTVQKLAQLLTLVAQKMSFVIAGRWTLFQNKFWPALHLFPNSSKRVSISEMKICTRASKIHTKLLFGKFPVNLCIF